jgi:hypothetical protein
MIVDKPATTILFAVNVNFSVPGSLAAAIAGGTRLKIDSETTRWLRAIASGET